MPDAPGAAKGGREDGVYWREPTCGLTVKGPSIARRGDGGPDFCVGLGAQVCSCSRWLAPHDQLEPAPDQVGSIRPASDKGQHSFACMHARTHARMLTDIPLQIPTTSRMHAQVYSSGQHEVDFNINRHSDGVVYVGVAVPHIAQDKTWCRRDANDQCWYYFGTGFTNALRNGWNDVVSKEVGGPEMKVPKLQPGDKVRVMLDMDAGVIKFSKFSLDDGSWKRIPGEIGGLREPVVMACCIQEKGDSVALSDSAKVVLKEGDAGSIEAKKKANKYAHVQSKLAALGALGNGSNDKDRDKDKASDPNGGEGGGLPPNRDALLQSRDVAQVQKQPRLGERERTTTTTRPWGVRAAQDARERAALASNGANGVQRSRERRSASLNRLPRGLGADAKVGAEVREAGGAGPGEDEADAKEPGAMTQRLESHLGVAVDVGDTLIGRSARSKGGAGARGSAGRAGGGVSLTRRGPPLVVNDVSLSVCLSLTRARTHARTHARTRARAHTHIHTHSISACVYLSQVYVHVF